MTDRHIKLVRDSWDRLTVEPDVTAAEFFVSLFAAAPRLMPAFMKPDMELQGACLVRWVDVLVGSLDRPDRLRPMAEAFGRRYADVTTDPGLEVAVGDAFVATLDAVLGGDMTPEHRDAWRSTVAELAVIIREAGWEVRAA